MADRQVRSRIIRALGGALVGVAFVGAGTAFAADQSVAISGFSFSPSSVTVSVGDTVTWTNSDPLAHTATADDSSWDTGTISGEGGTDAVTFTAAGTFPYHCSIHSQMTGTVTVEAAAEGAGTATTPPTDTAGTAPAEGGPGGLLAALLIAAVAWMVGAVIARGRAPNR